MKSWVSVRSEREKKRSGLHFIMFPPQAMKVERIRALRPRGNASSTSCHPKPHKMTTTIAMPTNALSLVSHFSFPVLMSHRRRSLSTSRSHRVPMSLSLLLAGFLCFHANPFQVRKTISRKFRQWPYGSIVKSSVGVCDFHHRACGVSSGQCDLGGGETLMRINS